MAQHFHANDDETRHQPDDAIAMLTADHRQVRALFQQYADTLRSVSEADYCRLSLPS